MVVISALDKPTLFRKLVRSMRGKRLVLGYIYHIAATHSYPNLQKIGMPLLSNELFINLKPPIGRQLSSSIVFIPSTGWINTIGAHSLRKLF